jgi:hypothetical protein
LTFLFLYTPCTLLHVTNILIHNLSMTKSPVSMFSVAKRGVPNRDLFNIIVLGTDHLTCRGVMVFCFVQNFFFRQHKSYNIYFFLLRKAQIFFQNTTLGYMTQTLNQIIFFFLHQIQNIFFSNIGNQNIFLEKNHNPPLQVKWSFPCTFIKSNNL